MPGCLMSARYTMLADFYRETTSRDEAGQIVRSWNKDDPYIVENLTEGILVAGISSLGSMEKWGDKYDPIEYAKMYITQQVIDVEEKGLITINKTFRVSNIRDKSTGKVLWINNLGDPIEFSVLGITPIQNPFGQNVEYEIVLKGLVD